MSPPRRWFQIHLSTVVVLGLATGFLMKKLHDHLRHAISGLDSFSTTEQLQIFGWNFLPVLPLLLCIALFSEWLIRCVRETKKP